MRTRTRTNTGMGTFKCYGMIFFLEIRTPHSLVTLITLAHATSHPGFALICYLQWQPPGGSRLVPGLVG